MWTAGWWKCYIDIRADAAVNIPALLATFLESDSDDADAPPGATRILKRDREMGGIRRVAKNISEIRRRIRRPLLTTRPEMVGIPPIPSSRQCRPIPHQ